MKKSSVKRRLFLFYIIAQKLLSEYNILVSIYIPNTISSINSAEAFKECKKLKNFMFEENSSLRYIGKSTFKNCTSLERIVLPSCLVILDEEAFAGCISLKEVYITSKKIIKPCKNLFKNCSLYLELYISENNIHIWRLIYKHNSSNINIIPIA